MKNIGSYFSVGRPVVAGGLNRYPAQTGRIGGVEPAVFQPEQSIEWVSEQIEVPVKVCEFDIGPAEGEMETCGNAQGGFVEASDHNFHTGRFGH